MPQPLLPLHPLLQVPSRRWFRRIEKNWYDMRVCLLQTIHAGKLKPCPWNLHLDTALFTLPGAASAAAAAATSQPGTPQRQA